PFFDTPQTPEKPLFLQRVNGYEPYQASSLTFLSPLELSLVCLVGQLIEEKPIKGFKFSLSFVEVAKRGG
ncbi:hypothetical protein, partial [Microcystis wesenbergii]|uniref:hypothetical protein n=1 Tax=Microcystis wesenbergii TaxID=44823 RepID=UPI001A7EF41B